MRALLQCDMRWKGAIGKRAASLEPLEAAEKAGGNYEVRNAVALRYWARVVGAARSEQIEQAERDLVELERLAKEMASTERVWARNTAEVLRLQATAWLALAKDEPDRAFELMRAAAELEGQTDKRRTQPGPRPSRSRTTGGHARRAGPSARGVGGIRSFDEPSPTSLQHLSWGGSGGEGCRKTRIGSGLLREVVGASIGGRHSRGAG